ncbi:MAG: ABC transporter permease [Candidatus Dormibacteraeota bacterium]|nr:ABC transporter permease [Candidatus Dormibacteraeota bacterium]
MHGTLQLLRRDWVELKGRPVGLAIKLVYPLVIGLPMLLLAPPRYSSMAITLLVATVGGLGTAAVLGRERAAGLHLRFRLAPRPAGLTVLDRVLAASSVDAAQVAPLLVVALVLHPDRVIWVPALVCALAGALMTVNALGAFASSLGSSPGEVMVWVMLPLLPSFYLSGLFVPPAGPLSVVALCLPFGYLRAGLEGVFGGHPAYGVATSAIGGLVFVAIGALGAYAAGRRVLEAE